MNILFIGKRHYTNRDALKERYGRIYQLPWLWARQGESTRLWLIDYHGKVREKKQDGALRLDSTPIRRTGWLAKTLALSLARLSGRACTHVVASGDAYIGLLGWIIARLSGARFVFDVYDKYDEFAGYRNVLGWDPFQFLLRRADQCWFASSRLLRQLGHAQRGDLLVMNGIDTQRFHPMDKAVARVRLGLPTDDYLVGYFGSMEPDRGVTNLIQAVSKLRRDGLAVNLVVAGRKHPATPIPDEPWLFDLGNVSFDDMPHAYAAVDVFAIPYLRSEFMDSGASNKIAEVLASGRPIAATRTPNLIDNFPETADALVQRLAKPGDIADLARIVRRQLESPIVTCLPQVLDFVHVAATAMAGLKSFPERPPPRPKAGDR